MSEPMERSSPSSSSVVHGRAEHWLKFRAVVEREYSTRVKTRWFFVSTLIAPILLAVLLFLPLAMATKSNPAAAALYNVTVLDATTTGLGERVAQVLGGGKYADQPMPEVRVVRTDTLANAERRSIGEALMERSSGYLLIDSQTVATGAAHYVGRRYDKDVDLLQIKEAIRQGIIGLRLERGYVHVDREFRTNIPGISAIGDVITFDQPGHQQLAHLSSAEGVALAERIAGKEFRPINYEQVPGCTYCDPEIGSVGLTEAKAKERGFDVQVGVFKFSVLGRARIANETEGFVKIVADKKYDEILGVHMIGPRSTELVAEATLALRLECTVEELMRTIHAHPTMSEAVGEAAHAVHGAAIHA